MTIKKIEIYSYKYHNTNNKNQIIIMSQKKVKVYPVDIECKIQGVSVVDNYTCTLNQTDITTNKNKFYIIQVLTDGKQYITYVRYGRIGERGTITTDNHYSKDSAIDDFYRKYKTKTGNNWQTTTFVKKAGKYFKTEVEYEVDEEEIKKNEKDPNVPEETLDLRLENLMKLYTDEKTMQNTLISLNIDPKKMPLGKISKAQLDSAEKILADIKSYIDNKNKISFESSESSESSEEVKPKKKNTKKVRSASESSEEVKPKKKNAKKVHRSRSESESSEENEEGKKEGKEEDQEDESLAKDEELLTKSSQFYTYIPYCCGRRKPPVIHNMKMLGQYTNMIDELRQLEVAVKVTKNNRNLVSVYKSLDANITPMSKTCDEWKMIEDYVKYTHAPTHRYKIELVDVYELDRKNEPPTVKETLKKVGNRFLLWHGSRMANFCSIIKNGLILNPESLNVPIAGKMFGYGVYFANAFSKSFNYCDSGTSNKHACLLLCEVALGNQCKKLNADVGLTKNKLDKDGYHSTWGVGKSTPSKIIKYNKDINVPNGVLKESKVNGSLLYDEFIAYDTNQISLKYLVVVKQV